MIESRKITTSCPHSTSLFAFSSTIPAIFTWRSAGSSKVEAITSAFTLRAISVTSSGRSSINSIIMYTSGWLAAMALAISFINRVLPVLGWATIKARCPLPIGEKRSTTRADIESEYPPLQSLNFSSGKRGVRWSKGTRSRTNAASRPSILDTFTNGKYFSPSLGGRMIPSTTSPVFRPNNLICDWDT